MVWFFFPHPINELKVKLWKLVPTPCCLFIPPKGWRESWETLVMVTVQEHKPNKRLRFNHKNREHCVLLILYQHNNENSMVTVDYSWKSSKTQMLPEKEYLRMPISIFKIESIINLPKQKAPGQMGSLVNCTMHLRKKLNQYSILSSRR